MFFPSSHGRGPKLAIITNAGGPGVLATDALIENHGGLAAFSSATFEALNALLPMAWSHGNPIDILGDADAQRYAQTLEVTVRDPNIDGLLAILTPQAMSDPTATAEALTQYAKIPGKPVLASWMGGLSVEPGEQVLDRAGIPTFAYPDTAAQIFTAMWRSYDNLQALYETPSLPSGGTTLATAKNRGELIIATARGEGRTILTESESKQLLSAYGIPTVETYVALTEDDAVTVARSIGLPVVLKLNSKTITHKTDVGGVQLNLTSDEAVRRAYQAIQTSVTKHAGAEHFHGVTVQSMVSLDGYELIVGSSVDPQFGPVLLFGAGGQLVEVFKDRALGLPPLNTTLARRMMERTKILTALKGVRGRQPIDIASLEELLVRFSDLVIEQRWIKEIDINPLLASPDRLLALDARVIVYERDVCDAEIPRPAIRAYPTQYTTFWTARDGTQLCLRPIRPEDEPSLVKFHGTLSDRSVALRYFHAMSLSSRVAHERLTRICFIDYDREMALVADEIDPSTNSHGIIGVGRLSKVRGTNEAEFALLVSDKFQGQGVGNVLLSRLIQIGRDEKTSRISGDILPENSAMRHLCEKLGFHVDYNAGDPVIRAVIDL